MRSARNISTDMKITVVCFVQTTKEKLGRGKVYNRIEGSIYLKVSASALTSIFSISLEIRDFNLDVCAVIARSN